ncbi:PKD domain-containing protein [Kitasatospora sp. NPDC051914]|uniref:PKD domain-containing protein n=1 Tax=Kitasatospora sp. NPDC051914 TaxID=3154945 RepID=UPI00343C5573
MRIHRTAALTVAGITGTLVLAAPAHAETPTTLYVSNNSGAGCTVTGDGTQQKPFCTIGEAAAVAQPGQTVEIRGGYYREQLVLTRSGEPDKPISFRGTGGSVGIQADDQSSRAAIAVNGVHDVVLEGLTAYGGTTVTGSDRVTFNKVVSNGVGTRPGVLVGNGSHDVAVTRSVIGAQQGSPLVKIEGATGTLLGRNLGGGSSDKPSVLVSAMDAPRTTVTNNTNTRGCGIVLSGDSADSNIFNNVFAAAAPPATCSGEARPPISVAASATTGTRVGHNLLSSTGTTVYSWGGTEYAAPEAFRQATGQGEKDLGVPAGTVPAGNLAPATDSADATAPGVLETDSAGKGPEDDPRVPNTGTGYGYLDRGAIEQHDNLTSVALAVDEAWAPYGTTVTATATPTHNWPSGLKYTFDFGDGTVVETSDTKASHVYTAPCKCTAKVTATTGGGVTRTSGPSSVQVTEPGDLQAALDVVHEGHNVQHTDFVPSLTFKADAARSTAPWQITGITYDFGDGTQQTTASLQEPAWHSYVAPGDYTVTVTLRDSKGHTSTASSTQHVAYEASKYVPDTPFRMLDTRTLGGAPLQGGTTLEFSVLPGRGWNDHMMASNPEAVVLNVTATNATADTFLTVFPGAQVLPTASSLNVKAGQTVANLVTVPLGKDGTVQVYNHAGRTDVVVDFVGYYNAFFGQGFTATSPARLSDAPMAGNTTSTMRVAGKAGVPADATAVVVNLTADRPTANGYLTAYPHGMARPTVSSLNFRAGQTIANQAIVPVRADGSIDIYNFTGNTRVVVDVFGYYSETGKGRFTPTTPTRLADTRADGSKQPLGPGAQLNLPIAGTHGAPANATAAVLNVTATQPTNPGYLTVWPDGTARPGTSNLNLAPGVTTPNHVTTPLGTNGRANIYNFSGNTHVIADLAGWFTES